MSLTREQWLMRRPAYAVKQALDAGIIKREPCKRCASPKSVAHHEDYSRTLDVTWLCQSCHMKYHHRIRRFVKFARAAADVFKRRGASDLADRARELMAESGKMNMTNFEEAL